MSYCIAVANMPSGERKVLHLKYHDHHYGYPIPDDNELFGRLVMEINQAGLSWETILRKETAFRNAYCQFDINTVAAFDEEDVARLLSDAGIIRNKLKIAAAIHNAQVIVKLQEEHGSFLKWLEFHHPKTKDEWVTLFRKSFRFTGGEIVNEFLMSTGFLPGAHDEDCPVFQRIVEAAPKWRTH